MVIAVDFDGTLCEDRYPSIGEPYYGRIRMLKHFKRAGCKIILWTCRNGQDLDDAVDWCRLRGIEFDAVNENLPETKEKWGGDTRKVYCDLYIDDKNLPATFLDE